LYEIILAIFAAPMYNINVSILLDVARCVMDWMTTKEASALWGISTRRIQILCDNDKVEGAQRLGNIWVIPKGTAKPIDGRTKEAKANNKNEDK
jgi:hypothetical protein